MTTLRERALDLIIEFADVARNLRRSLCPRRSILSDEEQVKIAGTLRALSAEAAKQRRYTGEELYAEYLKPLSDARKKSLRKAR